jgi:3-hydroxybutyryl-CoA dehydratase
MDSSKRPHRGMDAVRIGESYEFHKTVTDADVSLFAGLSGDFHRLHLDDEYAKQTPYGRRIAHGAMLLGFMSTASTILSDRLEERVPQPNVSLGYNKVRFTAPVFIGDTITTTITVTEKLEEQDRVLCEERCVNQRGQLVAIAEHVMKFV